MVIDDELIARKRVLNLLDEVEKIKVIGDFGSGLTALEKINELAPDMLFLDINMKDTTGFEILKNIKCNPKPIVVFVTAYDHYALKAFDFDAFDFLLKPYKDERFYKTITKALSLSRKEIDTNFEEKMNQFMKVYGDEKEAQSSLSKLPVKEGNTIILLNKSDIKYIIASGYYAEIFTTAKKHLLRESLTNLITILKDKRFFRVHRSAIVNLDYIHEIVQSDFSEIDVRMTDNKLIRISKAKKKNFYKAIGL